MAKSQSEVWSVGNPGIDSTTVVQRPLCGSSRRRPAMMSHLTRSCAQVASSLFVWLLAISLGAAPFLGLFSPIRLLPNVASTPVVPLNEEEEKTSSSTLPFGEKVRRQMRLILSSERYVAAPCNRQMNNDLLEITPTQQSSFQRWNNCLHCGQRLPMRC